MISSSVGVTMVFLFLLGTLEVCLSHGQSQWSLMAKGPWYGREGVMGASLNGYIYLIGGRGYGGLGFFKDVWRSTNGSDWTQIVTSAPWADRAYHIVVVHNNALYLMGGQNFFAFYNDVWRSTDGIEWTLVNQAAPWAIRAGLAAVSWNGQLIVTGGSYQTTPVSPRSFYNDVWASPDGINWKQLTPNAGFAPCSGPRLVVHQSNLFLLGGEDGFSEATQYNHVWSSADGSSWRFVTNATWSKRSGHGVVSYNGLLYVLAGYLDLHDLWTSPNGLQWELVSNSTFNCDAQPCGRFDFWTLVHEGAMVIFGGTSAWSTFGNMFDETWSYLLPQ